MALSPSYLDCALHHVPSLMVTSLPFPVAVPILPFLERVGVTVVQGWSPLLLFRINPARRWLAAATVVDAPLVAVSAAN